MFRPPRMASLSLAVETDWPSPITEILPPVREPLAVAAVTANSESSITRLSPSSGRATPVAKSTPPSSAMTSGMSVGRSGAPVESSARLAKRLASARPSSKGRIVDSTGSPKAFSMIESTSPSALAPMASSPYELQEEMAPLVASCTSPDEMIRPATLVSESLRSPRLPRIPALTGANDPARPGLAL